MDSESMKLHGLALLDFYNGDTTATIEVIRDDGYFDELNVSFFFRGQSDFLPMEQTALDLCRGRVLDIGAGAGPHSLFLQNKGLITCAIDISSEACEVMKKRGVKNVQCIDFFNFKAGQFDTILILGRSIGMVGNLTRLSYFLSDIHRLVKPDGQILLDSLDVRLTDKPVHLTYQKNNSKNGLYFGEIRMFFKYKGQKSPLIKWLQVDPETLTDCALKTGWACDILVQEGDGNYLAKLTPSNSKK